MSGNLKLNDLTAMAVHFHKGRELKFVPQIF